MLMHSEDACRRDDQQDVLIDTLRALVAEWDAKNPDESFPSERLASLARAGFLSSFCLLDATAATLRLLTALRLVGGADLSLGRIYEGHVNACQLIYSLGACSQRCTLADDLGAGRIFGVWNTDAEDGVTIHETASGWRLNGRKRFASGAGHIDRALITASRSDGSRQIVVVDVGSRPDRADNRGWRVRGMRGTQSGLYDFSGMTVSEAALLGDPGDYECEPRLSAGAWRFAAVQLGAVEALLRHWRGNLIRSGKNGDPVQRTRFGSAVAATRSAALWVERGAILAEEGGSDAVPLVFMARGVVEDAALQVMEGAARAIGTASFFEASRIDRITRDLSLYLRQPAPDETRDRAAISWLERDCWGTDAWW